MHKFICKKLGSLFDFRPATSRDRVIGNNAINLKVNHSGTIFRSVDAIRENPYPRSMKFFHLPWGNDLLIGVPGRAAVLSP